MSAAPEGVDLDRLAPWFAEHVPGATGAPLRAELIAGGRSNLTYSVSDGSRTWVLRRPPLGHVVATAHDMAREYRVLAGLASTDVPVPRVDALCEDVDVNSAPFYVMELVDGRILRTPEDMAGLTADDARRCSHALIDVLAGLHAVDYDAVGLGAFGRPDGFLARNVARWGKQWQANKTRDLPQIDELAARLDRALPESGPPAIVHGDYRLDNTMLAPDDVGRIVAVLDWEMSTLGDPLTDLGLFLVYWGGDNGPAVGSSVGIASVDGFVSKDEIVARYAERSGRSIEHLDFYVVFATYKLAVILEGINARFLMGKTLGEGFTEMGEMVVALADRALEIADRAADPRFAADLVVDDRWLRVTPSCRIDRRELVWRVSRSGGPGGQHANTSDTRVEVALDVAASPSLGPRQRARLLERLGPVVRATAADSRSQARNRELALERLRARLARGLAVERPRRPTRPTRAARERREDAKRRRSRQKQQRRRPDLDD